MWVTVTQSVRIVLYLSMNRTLRLAKDANQSIRHDPYTGIMKKGIQHSNSFLVLAIHNTIDHLILVASKPIYQLKNSKCFSTQVIRGDNM